MKNYFADRALQALKKDYLVIGKTRVLGWHAWLVIGLAAGIVAGIGLVASRGGEFEQGRSEVVLTAWGQIGNPYYRPMIVNPGLGGGRIIKIDALHNNFHHCAGDKYTTPLNPEQPNVGRYWAFCELLSKNGFVAADLSSGPLDISTLIGVDTFVMVHAAPAHYMIPDPKGSTRPVPNPYASGPALSEKEVSLILDRVSKGKMGLFIIMDHAPFVINQTAILTALGLYSVLAPPKDYLSVLDNLRANSLLGTGYLLFTASNGGLPYPGHPIVKGLSYVDTASGCGLQIPANAKAILKYSSASQAIYETYESWIALAYGNLETWLSGFSYGSAAQQAFMIEMTYKKVAEDPGGRVIVACDGGTFTSQIDQFPAGGGSPKPFGGLIFPSNHSTEQLVLQIISYVSDHPVSAGK